MSFEKLKTSWARDCCCCEIRGRCAFGNVLQSGLNCRHRPNPDSCSVSGNPNNRDLRTRVTRHFIPVLLCCMSSPRRYLNCTRRELAISTKYHSRWNNTPKRRSKLETKCERIFKTTRMMPPTKTCRNERKGSFWFSWFLFLLPSSELTSRQHRKLLVHFRLMNTMHPLVNQIEQPRSLSSSVDCR